MVRFIAVKHEIAQLRLVYHIGSIQKANFVQINSGISVIFDYLLLIGGYFKLETDSLKL
jgi:hypothetical protein